MQHRANPAEVLCQSPGGLQAAQSAYADLDAKLREVGAEIDKQHASIVGSRTHNSFKPTSLRGAASFKHQAT